MATILEFRASALEPAEKPRGRRRRRSAEIVIFPGVRYERYADAGESSQSKAVVRDVLTVGD